ncbi:hypothetical protein FRC19_011042 [Serendipita sp. 401]|nr:hypothetical protein FRC18_006915 [Serendipita sp. 400]KAG8817853.1 hypothetical protein FRC19_011042 [Serendipita sp. 401]KAG9051974.1 hypothetical protein FS842_010728 [Serendipita sp. 407]
MSQREQPSTGFELNQYPAVRIGDAINTGSDLLKLRLKTGTVDTFLRRGRQKKSKWVVGML